MKPETISAGETAKRLRISDNPVLRLIREGVLPAEQPLLAPWRAPVAALESAAVAAAGQAIVERRSRDYIRQNPSNLKLAGFGLRSDLLCIAYTRIFRGGSRRLSRRWFAWFLPSGRAAISPRKKPLREAEAGTLNQSRNRSEWLKRAAANMFLPGEAVLA